MAHTEDRGVGTLKKRGTSLPPGVNHALTENEDGSGAVVYQQRQTGKVILETAQGRQKVIATGTPYSPVTSRVQPAQTQGAVAPSTTASSANSSAEQPTTEVQSPTLPDISLMDFYNTLTYSGERLIEILAPPSYLDLKAHAGGNPTAEAAALRLSVENFPEDMTLQDYLFYMGYAQISWDPEAAAAVNAVYDAWDKSRQSRQEQLDLLSTYALISTESTQITQQDISANHSDPERETYITILEETQHLYGGSDMLLPYLDSLSTEELRDLLYGENSTQNIVYSRIWGRDVNWALNSPIVAADIYDRFWTLSPEERYYYLNSVSTALRDLEAGLDPYQGLSSVTAGDLDLSVLEEAGLLIPQVNAAPDAELQQLYNDTINQIRETLSTIGEDELAALMFDVSITAARYPDDAFDNIADAMTEGVGFLTSGGLAIVLGPFNTGDILKFNQEDAPSVLFGQRRVSQEFGTNHRIPDEILEEIIGKDNYETWIKGQSFYDVADAIRQGHLLPENIPIQVFEHEQGLVAINNRGLTTLSLAEMRPNVLIVTSLSEPIEARLAEDAILTPDFYNVPDNRIVVPGRFTALTPSQRDLTVLDVIRIHEDK